VPQSEQPTHSKERNEITVCNLSEKLWKGNCMMKLVLYDTRVQCATAVFLALIAGYLDGYGLLFLKTNVSFMIGNTTFTGLKSGQANFQAALPSAIAIVFFVTGSFLGNLFTQSRLRYSHRMIFGLTAGLLATVASLERHGLWNAAAEIAMLSMAMGMMNPALSKVGAESVSLTFVTGTLSRIGGDLASAAGQKPLPDGRGPADSHLARARIDASVLVRVSDRRGAVRNGRFALPDVGPAASVCRHDCLGSVQRVGHTITREENYKFDLRECAAQCSSVSIEVS
jgi:uncharacterized membrane protein YoaK (UPF0700 family)